MVGADALQARMVALIRAFGLHRTDETPCGQPVSVSAAHALMELTRQESLSHTALAAHLRLEKSTVSRLVKHLEGRGWLVQGRDPTDGRVGRLRLTEAGRRTSAQLAAARAARFARIATRIPSEEQEAVLHALDVLARAMSAAADAEGPRAIDEADLSDPTANPWQVVSAGQT